MQKIINNLKPAKHLLISILCVLPAFLLFYPKTFTTIDEHDYLYNAHLLAEGNLKTDCSLNIPGQWQTHLGYCISKYNIGTSFFLIPAAVINKDLAALTTLLVFIGGIVIFYKLLIQYNIDKRFIYFFALFPPFIFFSRTIMSEMYSMVALLAIFYCFTNLNKSFFYKTLTGIFITFALYIRYTNLIPIVIMGTYFLYEYVKQYGLKNVIFKYWIVHLFTILSLISLMIFNQAYYGHFLRSGYYFSSEEGRIVLEQIPAVLFKYIVLLNVFYPFALFYFFRTKIKRHVLFLLCVGSLLFFYTILKNESFPGKLSDVILGLRFLIPVYPFILLPYFEKLQSLKSERYFKTFLYLAIAVLFIGDFILNYIHYQFILK